MIRIVSEAELLGFFRPIDRAEVALPEEMRFPMGLRDYLAWTDPSGYRLHVVFQDPQSGAPLGMVFRRDQGAGGAAAMCEWCHSIRSGNDVGLLTASASDHRRVGVTLCRDLSCKEKAEGEPGVDDVPQGLSPRERTRKIIQRMAAFARRNLF